ncbi:DUF1573 domain-containing protein [Gimesia maris]|uniref:DUF1573 domain-containing protein n=1 Tax=Gimesia maris TaxID=122 RepID=A0ABX5YIA7_9PLAN|nr:DUF1573 domain-containing protein [Gimesia maris]EDL56691.1 hypothetical protein PM8797T_17669 [Gimesia maris DSM 8797]QDT77824.1 hypothetical protein Mal35_12520 [Gimesia maris]QDU13486.1 hypothetical protein CA11_12690 [Gimesia maris]QEG15414.1 hypothetical protein GmarT_12540 [Gimesia maris]QGQ31269.1 DUF1573 domain-containing protein [Gimesia maris]
MNLRAVTALIALVIALAGTVWLGRGNGDIQPAAPVPKQTDPSDDRPKISPTGPYPKAVVDTPLYNFGSMAVGQSLSHNFILKNEGEVPLEVQKGATTCKCTLSEMKENMVAPGESIKIELTWTPKSPQQNFGQTATIYTNDPKNQELKLQIEGTANNLIAFTGDFEGSPHWSLPTMSTTDPVSFSGKIHTKYLDEFKILGIESSKPGLTSKFRPLTAEELKEADTKSGYTIEVTADPEQFPLGGFTERLTVKTDIPHDLSPPGTEEKHDHPEGHDHKHDHEHATPEGPRTFVIQVSGNHTGPIRIVPTYGVHWNPNTMILNLGEFPAKEGKTVTLSMFVEGTEHSLEIVDQEIAPDFLEFELKKDDKFESKTKQRYELKFAVPAEMSPVSFGRTNLAKVKLQTNHPNAKEIEFRVQFISL